MRKTGLDFLLFGVLPVLVVVVCGIGLIGGITDAEAFVPVYLAGLIFGIVAVFMYGVGALFRTARWLVTNIR